MLAQKTVYKIFYKVSCFRVMNYRIPDGKTGQQVVDLLQKRVELLGATKSGTFSVDYEMHQARQRAYACVCT